MMNVESIPPVAPPQALPPAPPNPRRRFGIATLLFVALLSAGAAAAAALTISHQHSPGSEAAARESDGPSVYQCPMHPSIIRDHPGECPICGMKLLKVEKTKVESASQPDVAPGSPVPDLANVEIDVAKQQLIGLKTAEVTEGPVGGAWRTVGRVAIDETRVRHINLKVAGFVDRVYVDFVGKRVKKGDPLFSVYSPELLSAQEEYLLALKTRSALSVRGTARSNDGEDLVTAAKRKLALWDIPASQVAKLESTGQAQKTLTLLSPVSGVVTRKDVVEGMKLDAGAMPYEIVDLSSVWVLADVYESELRFVTDKMQATLKLSAFPNRDFKGKVLFIDPLMNPETRTVKVRLAFPNPQGELRPEMFGEVVLLGAAHDALRIPLDAVIDSGTEKVVFVASGEGKFQPRKVTLGQSDGTQVEILSGLAAAERVVIRANFLIDSESRLRASIAQTTPEAKSAEPLQSARALGSLRHEP